MSMELFSAIKKLTDKVMRGNTINDVDDCLLLAAQCESELTGWYSEKKNPDNRLIKLLKNLIFYLKASDSEISFQNEILIAIAKTLQQTADYDLNIREFPERVVKRNSEIIELCKKLQKEEKLPVEEASDKPYDVTIYMATFNQLELTKLCIESVFENTGDVSYEFYLIDNGSSDGSYEYFKNDKRIKLIRLEENTGLLLALQIFYESGLDNGKFWLYMNNDVVVTPRWASNMLKCITSDPHIGSVMPTTNRTAMFACIQQPLGLYDVDDVQAFGERFNVSNPVLWQDWIMYYGFVLLARPSVRKKFGFHEDCFYFSFYFSDGDITLLQTKAGYRTVQARDTYIHHFDGGHTVLQNRRSALDEGEKQFFKKHGFFSTDLERYLPVGIAVGVSAGAATVGSGIVTAGVAAKILFLGSSRSHPLLQLQKINEAMGNNNVEYYAADVMEQLKLEQYGRNVKFQQIDNWYEVETVFSSQIFDAVIYLDDIMKLRKPDRFLSAVYNRLSVNGKFYFQSDNSGCFLALNYILMSRRKSPRDSVRIRKNSIASINEVAELLGNVGFSIDVVEESFYNETFTYADLNTISNYRKLFDGEDFAVFERNIRVPIRNITARKPGKINIDNTLEQLLYRKKGND